ncbi:MAG: hypothetical protein WCL34_01955 [Methylococcaceae bacterium]|jgi:hypothetical protein
MKKIVLISIVTLMFTGCSDKNNYNAAVLAELSRDQKVEGAKEYNVPQDKMADCIVEASAKNMDGIFAFDPARLTAYRNYTKMLTLTQSEDPKKTLDELREAFGSAKNLMEARNNYTESELECLTLFVANTNTEDKTESKK